MLQSYSFFSRLRLLPHAFKRFLSFWTSIGAHSSGGLRPPQHQAVYSGILSDLGADRYYLTWGREILSDLVLRRPETSATMRLTPYSFHRAPNAI